MSANDPKRRRQVARLGGLTAAATTDMAELGRRSAAARLQKFFLETDASLPEEERWKKAELLQRAYMQRLRLKATS